MDKFKKIIILSIIIGISSLIYLDVLVSDFRISFAAVFFPLFILLYNELNSIYLGIATGFSVVLWRGLVYWLRYGTYSEGYITYHPVIIFYISYGLILHLLAKGGTYKNYNKLFFIMVFGDFTSNLIEIIIRLDSNISYNFISIVLGLFFVATIRASIVWIILNGHKYYKLLLIRGEHEKRYRKLLWMTSRLRTEMYWMEKNMDNIEKVMSNAYNLFENITNNRDKDSWGLTSCEIAKDVHEIKKEYSLALRGVKEIVENKIQDSGMYFNDLLLILKESIENHIEYCDKNIVVKFKGDKNFYTTKHYYLMSIFRNIIMNSIDSIIDDTKGEVSFIYSKNEVEYVFEIIDNGCGIDKDDLDHIFSPGFSTKINYDTGQINRGLGLSLVKSILKGKLDGKIEVSSEKEMGTSFKIYIPICSLEG